MSDTTEGGRGEEKKPNFWQRDLAKINCKMCARYILLYIETIKSGFETIFICLLPG